MLNWEQEGRRRGTLCWKLQGFPLDQGQHRPTITDTSDGEYIASAISGYMRKFATLDEAKAYAGHGVPTKNLAKLLTEEQWNVIRGVLSDAISHYPDEPGEMPPADKVEEILNILDPSA